eukprot:c20768_g1_i2 orf=104-325(+)
MLMMLKTTRKNTGKEALSHIEKCPKLLGYHMWHLKQQPLQDGISMMQGQEMAVSRHHVSASRSGNSLKMYDIT